VLSESKDTEIAIIGDGGWGTTLAIHLAKHGHACTMWGSFPEYLAEIESLRENRKFLPGFHIPENVFFEKNLSKCVSESIIVILAIPSQYIRRVLKRISNKDIFKKSWICVSKGIEKNSLKMMSEVIEDELGRVPLAVLSGPTIAREVVCGMPTAVSIASTKPGLCARIRKLLNSDHFTAYETDDLIGVELGGAIKNVIAIAAGIVDGLGYGSNTKSVLMARGIAEMARLGEKLGAKRTTFMGLSGLGDLATTCFSIHSRNHSCGVEIGKGNSLKSILANTEMIIEGVDTTKSVYELAKKSHIEMPIVKSVHDILYKAKGPKAAIEALMHKKLINETD
jgi:glycerol-3-phosphate dehydrogenase (NAD(P)+)